MAFIFRCTLLALLLAQSTAKSNRTSNTTPPAVNPLSVKASNFDKVYERSDKALFVKGPGMGKSAYPVFEKLVRGEHVDMEFDNTKNRVKVSLRPSKSWGEPGSDLLVVRTENANSETVWTPSEPVKVGKVLATPVVEENKGAVAIHAKRIIIDGSGFDPKHLFLTFGPENLMAGVDYNMLIDSEEILLTLKTKDGKAWGKKGALYITSVDTGGGAFAVGDGENGVQIATLVEDEHPDVQMPVVTEDKKTAVYNSRTRSITIKGTGFTENQFIGFRGDCASMDDDFEVKFVSATEITVTLKPGKEWCVADFLDEASSHPVPLRVQATLKEGNALPKPVQIAAILPDPDVEKNEAAIIVDKTRVLEIEGDGFVAGATVITFDPPLEEGHDKDYYQQVDMSLTEVDIFLNPGKVWTSSSKLPDTLKVVSIDTGAGPIVLNDGAGVVVAKIVKGSPAVKEVEASHDKIYASLGQHWIVVEGKDIGSGGPTMVKLGPEDCTSKEGYDVKKLTNDAINITLEGTGSMWCDFAGPLYIREISYAKNKVKSFTSKGKTEGVQIAYVLDDPEVLEDDSEIFATHTKTLIIDVDGVPQTKEQEVLVQLEPENSGVYKFEVHNNDELVLHLEEGAHWTGDANDKLWVSAINTGAGWARIEKTQVAIVKPDGVTSLCSDECEFANDGVCDDDASEEYYRVDYETYGESFTTCEWGTDCKDCGVREVATFSPTPSPVEFSFGRCDDSCEDGRFKADGECDDGRPGAISQACDLGTDCTDCGAIPSNENNNEVDLLDASMCTSGLYGTALMGERCKFPFTHNGVEYNECSFDDVAPAATRGWCSTTADYDADQMWGSCAYCFDVNAEMEYYYDEYQLFYYEYQYEYNEILDENGNKQTTKTKVQVKVPKTPVVDPHLGEVPSSSSVGGSIVGIIGLILMTGAGIVAYRKFVKSTGSNSGGAYGPVSNRDVELASAGMPMHAGGRGVVSAGITPDRFTT